MSIIKIIKEMLETQEVVMVRFYNVISPILVYSVDGDFIETNKGNFHSKFVKEVIV